MTFSIICALMTSCHKKEMKKPAPSLPVQTVLSQQKDVYAHIDTIGHVDPIISVDVRSRVEGELVQVHFKEGQEVKKDDLLFTIDPRPFEIKLKETTATLARNEANLKQASDKLTRYTPLLKDEYISQLDYDQLLTDVAVLQATVRENAAMVDAAKLQLEYCYIYSPLEGKTGILKVDQGNMIAPNAQEPLISIHQLQPIYVRFSVPEKDLTEIQKYKKDNELTVLTAFDKFDENAFVGRLIQIDNQVNMKTAQVQLRALYDNESKYLWPGKFVRVRVLLYPIPKAIVIPYQAVEMTSEGPVVFVVTPDDTVTLQKVKLGQRMDENIVIEQGITASTRIVVKGQLNLSNGVSVYEQIDEAQEP